MKRARFVAPARREHLAEVACFNNKEQGLGGRFLTAVEDATARALAYPLTVTPASENTRQMFLKEFPFALVYGPDENGIVVFALAQHARRPEYWRDRIDDRQQCHSPEPPPEGNLDVYNPLRPGDGKRGHELVWAIEVQKLRQWIHARTAGSHAPAGCGQGWEHTYRREHTGADQELP